MSKVLITGSTGMVGAFLLKSILKNKIFTTIILPYRTEEKKEILLSFLMKENIDLSSCFLDWRLGDLEDIVFVDSLIEDNLSIFHCAAIVSFNKKDKANMQKVNLLITENLVHYSLDKKNIYFLHLSSIAAIGRAENNKPISEDTEWKPSVNNSAYAVSKYTSEMVVWKGINEGLNAAIINPSIILGVYKGSISSIEVFKMAYKEFPFYATGSNGFVDVRDVADIMLYLNEQKIRNNRFIVSHSTIKYKYIFDCLAEFMNKKKPKYKVTAFLGNTVLFFETLLSFVGRKKKLSKELLTTSLQDNVYENEKLIREIGFKYRNMDNTLQYFAEKMVELNG